MAGIDKELIDVATKGDLKRVSELLKRGASVSVVDKNGRTPLHTATFKGQVDVAKLLLERGANPNARDEEGMTPAEVARMLGHTTLADLIEGQLHLCTSSQR